MQPEVLQVSKLSYACVFSLPSQVFQKLCRDLKGSLKADTVTVEARSDVVSFSGESSFGSLQLDFEPPQLAMHKFDSISKLIFSHPHLTRFGKVTPLASSITVSLGASSNPLMLEYNLEKIGHVQFFLAQKV